MLSVIYNGIPLTQVPSDLQVVHRAISYGDGLFETIRVHHGQAPLLHLHIERLMRGLTQMGFDLPSTWGVDFFDVEMSKLAPLHARVRITVWRSAGGLYLPENNQPQWLITAKDLIHPIWQWTNYPNKVGISAQVRLSMDSVSHLKAFNTPRYVIASIEAKKNDWDDIIILNSADRPCESASCNLFWWKDDICYTPPVSEGCVAGVMRHWLIKQQQQNSSWPTIIEQPATIEILHEADEVFLTNSIRGIVPVYEFDGHQKKTSQTRQLFDLALPQMFG
jgi:branched-chain amino acid aminotransferase